MAVKKYKPTTPGRRKMSVVSFDSLTKKSPEKRLTSSMKNKAGRSGGKIAVRRRGGGHKRKYRVMDFSRLRKKDIPANIAAIEYDPNRTSFIALAVYADGDKQYIVAEESMKVGDKVVCADKAKARKGNRMQLQHIPEGFDVYNIELVPGRGGKLVRGAGLAARLVAIDGDYAQIQLPSGEVRAVKKECFGTVGRASNIDHSNVVLGKAGRSRWLRRRPKVRGKAMNPVDHPHGGGEGAQPIGLKHPKTPWGMPALGFKTRKKKKSSKLILKDRRRK